MINQTHSEKSLLATAQVKLLADGKFVILKAVLDPGSTTSFIPQKAVNELKFMSKPAQIDIIGIGNICSVLNNESIASNETKKGTYVDSAIITAS